MEVMLSAVTSGGLLPDEVIPLCCPTGERNADEELRGAADGALGLVTGRC